MEKKNLQTERNEKIYFEILKFLKFLKFLKWFNSLQAGERAA